MGSVLGQNAVTCANVRNFFTPVSHSFPGWSWRNTDYTEWFVINAARLVL